jgi:hypothetical protein
MPFEKIGIRFPDPSTPLELLIYVEVATVFAMVPLVVSWWVMKRWRRSHIE